MNNDNSPPPELTIYGSAYPLHGTPRVTGVSESAVTISIGKLGSGSDVTLTFSSLEWLDALKSAVVVAEAAWVTL